MPRSGYSREDPVAIRSGYVAHNNEPVDHRGGPESHSGRLNHARMNERASPDTFRPLSILNLAVFMSRVASFSRLLLPTCRRFHPEMTSIEANPVRSTKEEPEDLILVTSVSACLLLAAALNLEAWTMVTVVSYAFFVANKPFSDHFWDM